MANSTQPEIHTIFEAKTSTWQYIVADPVTKAAAIIDSVLDYDTTAATVTMASANGLLDIIKRHSYHVLYILETRAHIDHLTASKYIKKTLRQVGIANPKICIGKRSDQVQHNFATKYGVEQSDYVSAFDRLLDDGERLSLGNLEIEVLHLPSRTPDHVGYVIGSNVFTGDPLFQSDVDSSGDDATALFTSMRKVLSLPPSYRLYSGHNYPPKQNDSRNKPRAFAIVAEQREKNKHVHDGVSMKEEYVEWRRERDATSGESWPAHNALQFKTRAGQLPVKSEYSHRFVHVP